MSDYTPSLEEAREQYWAASGDPRRDSGAWGEFDRMIETVRAEEREKADREPSEDVPTSSNGEWIICGDDWVPERVYNLLVDLQADREPSDAEVAAAGRGLYENRVSLIEGEAERRSWPTWAGLEKTDADEWRDAGRAALLAAREVRNRG